MKILIGGLLIVHGLIVSAQSSGAFSGSNGVQNPAWLGWWPVSLGESWLLRGQTGGLAVVFGLLWLVGGLCLVASGLSVFGIVVPHHLWQPLAITGGALSLLMLLVYAHPFFVLGLLISAAILYAQVVAHWPPETLLGA